MRAPWRRSSSWSMATSDSNWWILASFALPLLINASRPVSIAMRRMPMTLSTAVRTEDRQCWGSRKISTSGSAISAGMEPPEITHLTRWPMMSSVAVDAIDESIFQHSAGSIDSLGDDRLCSGMAVLPVGWWQLVAQCSTGSSRSQTCGPGPVKSGRELEGRRRPKRSLEPLRSSASRNSFPKICLTSLGRIDLITFHTACCFVAPGREGGVHEAQAVARLLGQETGACDLWGRLWQGAVGTHHRRSAETSPPRFCPSQRHDLRRFGTLKHTRRASSPLSRAVFSCRLVPASGR